MAETWYRWEGEALVIELRVLPRASRDEFGRVQDGRRRLRVTSPPVEGKANAHIGKLLAKAFGVPRSRVILLSGVTGRDKRFRIEAPRALPPDLEIER